MVRPRKPRFVEEEPASEYFKPRGIPVGELEAVALSVDELEALKLVDRRGMSQVEAAERMEISRATLQRTLAGARKKVADALVDGKALEITGGEYVTAGMGSYRSLTCSSCGSCWEEPFGTGARACETACPECGEYAVFRSAPPGRGRRRGMRGEKPRGGGPGSRGMA